MQIYRLLEQKKAAIIERWCDLVIDTYPAEARDFFKQKKNRFDNPVGAQLHSQTAACLELFLAEAPDEEAAACLKDIIKIRSVQEFSPAQAVGFVLYLKQAIRELLSAEIRTHALFIELLTVESHIDRLQLCAFDSYSRSRDKMHEIRTDELRRRSFTAMKRMTLFKDSEDTQEDT